MQYYTTEPTRHYQTDVVLDSDRGEFPYKKFWRGDYKSSIPIILDRQAGFYPRKDDNNCSHAETRPTLTKHCYPQHCFATAPNTRFPCYQECTQDVTYYRRNLLNGTKIFLIR